MSSSDEVEIKFIFANYDGKEVLLKFPLNKSIEKVKNILYENWPETSNKNDYNPNKPTTIRQIRLICMGQGILQDNKTLTSCKVPKFSDHPTPINVSIRPLSSLDNNKNVESSRKGWLRRDSHSGISNSNNQSVDNSENGNNVNSSRCVCIIL